MNVTLHLLAIIGVWTVTWRLAWLFFVQQEKPEKGDVEFTHCGDAQCEICRLRDTNQRKNP